MQKTLGGLSILGQFCKLQKAEIKNHWFFNEIQQNNFI